MDEESGGALLFFIGNCVDNLDILNYSIYIYGSSTVVQNFS